jgi:hypothetical protein
MRFTTVLIEAVTALSFPAIVDADLFPNSFPNVERRRSHSLSATKTGETKSRSSPTTVSDLDDDKLVTEELLTLEYYQDNRFSSPDPLFGRYLYYNVRLHPVFGIDDLPIEGLAHGVCTETDIGGYCNFFYEFFDIIDDTIVLYASFTAEGPTNPKGPSMLSILGGTGAFENDTGTITLLPVSIDESVIPAQITRDDSLFLGNRVGYEAKIELKLQKPRGGSAYSGSLASSVLGTVSPTPAFAGLQIGTEYSFDGDLFDVQDLNSPVDPLQVDNQEVLFDANIDGYCDRIGPYDRDSVQGYCFLTYTFIDPSSQLTRGSFTAQGIIINSQASGQLIVTGGTGLMRGATGVVEILPAATDNKFYPPLLIQPVGDADPFIEVAGWAHFFEFDVDVLFSADPPLFVKSSKKGKDTKTKGAKKNSKKNK